MEDLISAYADGELDAATTARVEAHLMANPQARRLLTLHRDTTAQLRSAFPDAMFADGATPRLPMSAPVRRSPRIPVRGWAIAASVLIGILGYGVGATWPGLIASERSRMLTEIAEYHAVYARETVHLVEVPANDADHLKQWLGTLVERTLVIPDFSAAGLTFAGGRMLVLEGVPVAALMYTRKNGPPIAFCVSRHDGAASQVSVDRRGSIGLATWEDGRHVYIVVGEADTGLIRSLAEIAQRQT